MTQLWQHPHQEIESPVAFDWKPISGYHQEIRAWACWAGPNAVEIRIIRHLMTLPDAYIPGSVNVTYHDRKSAFYSTKNEWVDAKWDEVMDPWAIWTEEEAIRKGIKPLKKDVHVAAIDRDACLRCGYTGQQLHHDREAGFEFPCPGWLDVKIG